MALTSGTRLGPYEIVAPLGAGGMGEVYRARDTKLGRDVALKVLPEAFTQDPDRLARFEREARALAALNHPNIVTLYSLEEADGIRFLTMELVEGRTLAEEFLPGAPAADRVVELAMELAGALAAAHEKGVVHRDLKPANVMLTRDGRVKVLDFGLARLARAESALGATQAMTMASPISGAGFIVGTAPYMAPEQVRGESVDARTDLFALGIIIYELAAGRRPFAGATFADVTSSILRDAPEPLIGLRAELPGDLDRIVARCLEKSAPDRFQSALEVMNELRLLQRTLERGTTPPTRPAIPARETPSIAVLPFVNRSRDPDDEYFSDGLADELLNVLAKIRGLRVAARTSSFHFKGKDATIADVGHALNVATVLEGSVRRAGRRVRIAVQLVNVADGFHLWSETYDRTLDDIFAVQDDIARSVVKELRTTWLGEEADSKASGEARAVVAAAAQGRGRNPEAHALYLRGKYFLDRLSREDIAKGIGYLEDSLALDPENAMAWAQLATAFATEAGYGWVPVDAGFGRARDAAERALALAPDLAEAHAALCRIQASYEFDFKNAEASCRRALELAPGSHMVLRIASTFAQYFGRLDEAVELGRRAVETDPLSSTGYGRLGAICRVAGLRAEALEAFQKALELAPQQIATHMLISLVLYSEGRYEEALHEAQAEPAAWARLSALAVIHHALGQKADSDAALRELVEGFSEDSAYQVAVVHAARGEPDLAFTWLGRALAQRDSGLPSVVSEPLFPPLRDDPRWIPFLRKIGLAD